MIDFSCSDAWLDVYSQLEGVARNALVRKDYAKDVVQETLLQLLEADKSGDLNFELDSPEAKGWLLAWTRWNAKAQNRVDYRWSVDIESPPPSLADTPKEVYERRLVLHDLCETAQENSVVHFMMYGWSQIEIAEKLGISQSTVHRTILKVVKRELEKT